MKNFDQIEKICKGKNIRIFSSVQDTVHSVSFVETYRNCGKKSCKKCKNKANRPHGPYWNLNYADDQGKMRTIYVGKSLPAMAFKHGKLLFSDVVRFYQENEAQRETMARYRTETLHLKREVERLFEELRAARRSGRTKPTARAEKTYKQLVLKYHPDRNADKTFLAEEVMKDLNQLYRQLLEK